MAKYVLLQFDDEADADGIIHEILSHRPNADGISVEPGQFYQCTLRAVFKKPTKFCECTNVKKRGFTRGQKYGWWVCDQCKKPTQGWARLELAYQVFGKNLLPPSEDAPEYRGDGNWGTWHRGDKT